MSEVSKQHETQVVFAESEKKEKSFENHFVVKIYVLILLYSVIKSVWYCIYLFSPLLILLLFIEMYYSNMSLIIYI